MLSRSKQCLKKTETLVQDFGFYSFLPETSPNDPSQFLLRASMPDGV